MYFIIHIGIWLMVVSSVATTSGHYSNTQNSSRKWITELFANSQKNFSMEQAASEKCRNDYLLYLSHLRNQSVWAVRMKESSEWPSVGLYSGVVEHLGNWDGCLRASGPNDIAGKYCIAEIILKNLPIDDYDSDRHLTTKGCECEDCSAWSMLRKCSNDPLRADRRKIQWAICLPSSCSSGDLKKSLESFMIPVFDGSGLIIQVNLDSSMCSTRVLEPENYPKEYYITRSIFLSLIILAIAATINDTVLEKYNKTKGWFGQIISCFSATQSFQTLTETSEKTQNPLYFLKFLFIVFIVVVHRFHYMFFFPLFQLEEIEKDYYSGKLFFLTQMNGDDVYFLVSGFLLYRFSVQPMSIIGYPFIGIYAVFRLLKTIAPHGMTILFVANMLPYLGDGPLWNLSQALISQPCKTYWLTSLLAVNNFNGAGKLCLLPSWHLAVDSQNSLIGILLLFVLTKNRRLGLILIGLAFILSTISTGLVAYFLGVNGFHIFSIREMRDFDSYPNIHRMYTSFYPRLSPFLSGMITSILVEKWQKKNYKPSQTLSLFLFLPSLAGAILIQYYGFLSVFDTTYSGVWNSIFAGLYRPFYILPYAVLGIIYFTSGIGFLDFLFTRKIFFALGRLNLSILFCSYVFQMYHMATQRSLMPASSSLNMYMWAIADIIITLPVSLFFYLIVEGPFSNLIKLLKINLLKTVYVRRWTETNSKLKTK